jgi:hypothetical protein
MNGVMVLGSPSPVSTMNSVLGVSSCRVGEFQAQPTAAYTDRLSNRINTVSFANYPYTSGYRRTQKETSNMQS